MWWWWWYVVVAATARGGGGGGGVYTCMGHHRAHISISSSNMDNSCLRVKTHTS